MNAAHSGPFAFPPHAICLSGKRKRKEKEREEQDHEPQALVPIINLIEEKKRSQVTTLHNILIPFLDGGKEERGKKEKKEMVSRLWGPA